MPTTRGRTEVSRFMADLPGQLTNNVLRGAARAAVKVIAEGAKQRSKSDEVAQAIKTTVKVENITIIGKVQVKGKGAYIAPWLEYGTNKHFISVDDSQRQGRSVNRINKLANEPGSSHSLVINGKFVGTTVLHPGAQAHPFLRPALDDLGATAVAAAQQHINSKVTKAGIVPGTEPEGDGA